MKSIAIITARGASKRIPRKNIKPFCGKPIIIYSIEAAIKSGVFDEVMVSTEDREIAQIAISAGAKVPFLRSEATSNDFATTADVLKEVINQYASQGSNFDTACCIYPTAPFVTADKLRKGMELLNNSSVSSVIPVVAFSFPPQRGLVVRNEKVCSMYPEFSNTRSQDLENIYHDCGQFYCFKVDDFMSSSVLIGNNSMPLIMNELEVQDIDNLSDWKLAEIKYNMMIGERDVE